MHMRNSQESLYNSHYRFVTDLGRGFGNDVQNDGLQARLGCGDEDDEDVNEIDDARLRQIS